MYCNNVLLVVPCIPSTTSIPASQFTKTTTTTTTINNENTLPCFHWRKKVYTHEKHTNRQSKSKCTLKKHYTAPTANRHTQNIYSLLKFRLKTLNYYLFHSLYKISAIYIEYTHVCHIFLQSPPPNKPI